MISGWFYDRLKVDITCDNCKKPRNLKKYYTVVTDAGREWEDSFTWAHCLPCVIKVAIRGKKRMASRLIRRARATVKCYRFFPNALNTREKIRLARGVARSLVK